MDLSSALSNNIVYILLLTDDLRTAGTNIYLDQLSPRFLIKIVAPSLSFAGFSLAGIGDINNDGYSDLAIGSIPVKNGRFVQQLTYVLYGRGMSSDEDDAILYLNNLQVSGGFIIRGAGFLVTPVGDVNGDNIDDLMISGYTDWMKKGNTYLIHSPVFLQSPPTYFPSSSPSSVPTTLPSSIPSSNRPSSSPSSSPPTPLIVMPTNPVNSTPATPPVTPISLAPTRSPHFYPTKKPISSRNPTVSPSTTLPPSMKPTRAVFVLSTNPPSEFPTLRPTLLTPKPTVRPSRAPTPLITLSPEARSITVDYPDPGVYSGEIEEANLNYLITGQGNYQFIGVTNQQNTFVFYPNRPGQVVTISNFQIDYDLLDISQFHWIKQLTDISYTTNPVALLIPSSEHANKKQFIILSSLIDFSLTEKNFKLDLSTEGFSSSISSSSTTSTSTSSLLVLIVGIVSIIAVSASCFYYLQCYHPVDNDGTDLFISLRTKTDDCSNILGQVDEEENRHVKEWEDCVPDPLTVFPQIEAENTLPYLSRQSLEQNNLLEEASTPSISEVPHHQIGNRSDLYCSSSSTSASSSHGTASSDMLISSSRLLSEEGSNLDEENNGKIIQIITGDDALEEEFDDFHWNQFLTFSEENEGEDDLPKNDNSAVEFNLSRQGSIHQDHLHRGEDEESMDSLYFELYFGKGDH
jgi:hypothetical protein